MLVLTFAYNTVVYGVQLWPMLVIIYACVNGAALPLFSTLIS